MTTIRTILAAIPAVVATDIARAVGFVRAPRCTCQWEIGDSPCSVHECPVCKAAAREDGKPTCYACDEARAEKAEAALAALRAAQPAPFPWSDEAVTKAAKAGMAERDRVARHGLVFVDDDDLTLSKRIMRAALATLTPPPSPAPVQAALAAANIRVLGPGEGVVRVRVAEAGDAGGPYVYKDSGDPKGRWWGFGGGGIKPGTRYILAADLDAVETTLGKVGGK